MFPTCVARVRNETVVVRFAHVEFPSFPYNRFPSARDPRLLASSRTLTIRRDYLHYIKKYNRFEKRHRNLSAHVSPAFRDIKLGDMVHVGQCRPLSKVRPMYCCNRSRLEPPSLLYSPSFFLASGPKTGPSPRLMPKHVSWPMSLLQYSGTSAH